MVWETFAYGFVAACLAILSIVCYMRRQERLESIDRSIKDLNFSIYVIESRMNLACRDLFHYTETTEEKPKKK